MASEQLNTPLASANYLKPSSRKLLLMKNAKQNCEDDANWKKQDSSSNMWENNESPQLIDFSNLAIIGNSFLGKKPVVVSTPVLPLRNATFLSSSKENPLIESFPKIRLSIINHVDENEKINEEYVVHHTNVNTEKEDEKKSNIAKKPKYTTVKPFKFHLRENHNQEEKQGRINKRLEEDRKKRVFRANPVPAFLKPRPILTNNNNKINNNVESVESNAIKETQKQNTPEKQPKANVGVSRRRVARPKTPPLLTSIRALQRKHFDDAVKQKERQKEQQRRKEMAAKKKQEEEKIEQLRKQTVHKAQPIRKYKSSLPEIQKRPLTNPVTPELLKRRRII